MTAEQRRARDPNEDAVRTMVNSTRKKIDRVALLKTLKEALRGIERFHEFKQA
jgi:hypothetical protein